MTDRANWKLDDDELLSAIKIIERASTEDIGTHEGHPTFRAESVELPQIEGFRAVAFALPSVLQKWAGQVREVALDSACERYFILRETITYLNQCRGDQQESVRAICVRRRGLRIWLRNGLSFNQIFEEQ